MKKRTLMRRGLARRRAPARRRGGPPKRSGDQAECEVTIDRCPRLRDRAVPRVLQALSTSSSSSGPRGSTGHLRRGRPPGRHQPRRGDRVRIWWDRVNMRRFTRLVTARAWISSSTPLSLGRGLRGTPRAGRLATPHVMRHDRLRHAPAVGLRARGALLHGERGGRRLPLPLRVPQEKVSVTGHSHPPDPSAAPRGKGEARAALGLRRIARGAPARGGFGMGPVESIFRAILASLPSSPRRRRRAETRPVQRRLEGIPSGAPPGADPGFHEADRRVHGRGDLVSEAGGLTTAEALAREP